MAALVPNEKIAFVAKFDPDEVIVLPVIVFPSLPLAVPVEKNTVPSVVDVPAPLIVQLWIVLFVASAINRMVDGVAADSVLSNVKLLDPVTVTLSAPLRSTSGPAGLPEIVHDPPPG